jgi:hypothetical protein
MGHPAESLTDETSLLIPQLLDLIQIVGVGQPP